MPNQHKPLTVTPAMGGRLASDISFNEVGIANYRVKRDWRRYNDREIRREGEDYFWPDRTVAMGTQPGPFDGPLWLIHHMVDPTGRVGAIIGTPNSLYCHWAENDLSYVDGIGSVQEYVPIFGLAAQVQAAPNNYVTISGLTVGEQYLYTQGNSFQLTQDQAGNTPVTTDANGIFTATQNVYFLWLSPSQLTVTASIKSQVSPYVLDVPAGSGLTDANGDPVQPGPYVEDFSSTPWVRIGTGYAGGHRWEAVDLGADVVLNNGVDLPLVFSLAETSVTPLYELRENEVVSVGTVTQFNDVIMFADIRQIKSGQQTAVMGHISALAAWSGVTVTCPASTFTPAMVGMTLYTSRGEARKILAVSGDGSTATVDVTFKIGSQVDSTVSIENPMAYGRVPDEFCDRYRARVLWGELGQARRYAAAVPCGITAASTTLTFLFPSKSFTAGMKVLVTGAGATGANLTATIVSMATDGLSAVLDTAAATTVLTTDTVDGNGNILAAAGSVQAYDTIGGITGYDDLEEDNSAIIRMMELNGQLVLYRETGYQYAAYVGSVDATTGAVSAFAFTKMTKTSNTLYYKHSLIGVTMKGYNFHLFAGRNSLYRFDGVSLVPTETMTYATFNWQTQALPGDAVLCRRTMYNELAQGQTVTVAGATYDASEFVFSAKNEMTREIFICYRSTTEDRALCFDYEQGTFSTTAGDYTAAATIYKPGQTVTDPSRAEKWFVMGTPDGYLLQYGKTDLNQDAWGGVNFLISRRGQPYASEMYSGLGNFGTPYHEKHMRGYVLELSSFSPDTEVDVEIYGAANVNKPAPVGSSSKAWPQAVEASSDDIGDPENKGEAIQGTKVMLLDCKTLTVLDNFFPVHFQEYYFADRIVVNGVDNPCEITARTFDVAIVKTGSVTRAAG